MVLALKLSLGILVAILGIGVLLPYMISAASTELVLAGIFGVTFISMYGIIYSIKQIKNIITGEKNV